jgi:hypothetical protein
MNRKILNGIVFVGALSCLFSLPVLAQNASPANGVGIGSAPVNSKQHQILDTALSSQTRQTLQEAMNSVPSTDTAHAAASAK